MIFYNLKLKDLFDIYIWIENESKDFFQLQLLMQVRRQKLKLSLSFTPYFW